MIRTGVSSGPTGPGSGCGNGSGVGRGSGAGAVIGRPCRESPAALHESGLIPRHGWYPPWNRCPTRSKHHRHHAKRCWQHEADHREVVLS